MSLFDATAVTPPAPCSRCREWVAATSLFCPTCGQSTLRPLPQEPTPHSESNAEGNEGPVTSIDDSHTDPLQRATGWLRRSLNMGRKSDILSSPAESASVGVDHPTEVMSLFDIEEAEKVATSKRRKAPAPLRFELRFETGISFTVGETPGIIGVKPLPEQAEDGQHRIFFEDDSNTVAAEHLEFGLTRGVFWVKDLKTVAGTVVEEPGSPALQCIPYDTYPLVRGSRVVMGEVAFTLH